MKRDLDAAIAPLSTRAWLASAPALGCAFAVAAILAVYASTAASIVGIWWRSETFAHGFVVIPICLWFVWRARAALAATPARPWWPGLALVAAAGGLWIVASAADAQSVRQFALAFMLQAAIVTIVGLRVARVIAFPLAFLLFAVPAGEFLIPTMMDRTADFTVAALRFTGVPVHREGNHLVIPSGTWSVVEACSGVRYVIASAMVGTMFAAIAYRSTGRRVLFVIASIVVPVVANWLRAYMIVMIGHLSENRLAVGVDHILYGWVFFGIVMLLTFWVGSLWQEHERESASNVVPLSTLANPSTTVRAVAAAALAAVVVAGVFAPVQALMGRGAARPVPLLPAIAAQDGWTEKAGTVTRWRPLYAGYALEYRQTFAKDGRDVALHLAYYRNQVKGAELITSANILTLPESREWTQTLSGADEIDWAGRRAQVDRVELLGRPYAEELEVFRLYWIAGRVTSSEYVAKAWLAWSRLTGGVDDSALILVYTPIRNSDRAGATEALRSFARAMSGPIDRALAGAAAGGR